MSIRQNLPLYGVGALLAVLLILAVLLGQRQMLTGDATAGAGEAVNISQTAAYEPQLAALPASAADDAVIISELAPGDAREQNAETPIVVSKLKPAAPFRFRGSETDRLRARECLALAGMAEAGAGDADQRAVMQVILNRTRHPAFTNTVCGVVFQGSERVTGCQFTFTCDGSLSRAYPERMWRAARQRADEMLGGAVFAPVGNATHYHTDWVYPWWSPKLDKIAQVKTHLFFRWRGRWGSHAALSARYSGGEPNPAALRLSASAVNRSGLQFPGNNASQLEEGSDLMAANADPIIRSPARGIHFLLVGPEHDASGLAEQANALCSGSGFCQVYGWSEAGDIPANVPLSATARRTLRFSFVPGRKTAADTVFFDCRLFPSAPPGSCLPAAPNDRGSGVPSRTSTRAAEQAALPAPKPLPSASSSLPDSGRLKADAEAGTLKTP